MARKIYRNEYDIRTTSYYQGQGGVYNEIITILTKMRKEASFRGMPSTSVMLNEASYWWDVIFNNWCENGYKYQIPSDLHDNLTLCILACIAAEQIDCRSYLTGDLDELYYFVQSIQEKLKTDKVYYPKFKQLIDSLQDNHKEGLEELQSEIHKKKVKELTEIIEKQNETLAKQSSLIYRLESENIEMQKRCALAETKCYEGSEFDRWLTLDNILQWIESRHHYIYTEQVFRMLADMKDKVATEEEREKIRKLENQMLDKNQMQAIFNQNIGLNSNMMTGMVDSPQLPIGVSPTDLQQMLQQFIKQWNYGKGEE